MNSIFKYFQILLLALISLGASAQDDDMKTDVGITRGRNIHLWPVFYREKNDNDKKIAIAASLFEYKRDYLNKSVHTHLLPLFTYDSSSFAKDIRIGSIFYPSIFRRTENFQDTIKTVKFLEIVPSIDLVEFSRSPSGDYLKNNLLFFLWYKNDLKNQKSHLVLFPLFWRYKEKDDAYNVLLPLFFHHRNDFYDESETWITPLFYHSIDRKSVHRSVLFPAYWHKRDGKESTDVLFPLFWRKRNGDIKTDILFPFVWRYSKPGTKFFSLFPLFAYGQSDYKNKSYFAITPLLWSIKKNDVSLKFLFPLYWRKRKLDDKTDVLFPLVWRYNKPWKKSLVVMPLFAYGKNTLKNKSFFAVTPLLWSIKKPDYSFNFLAPVYWKKKSFSKNDTLNKTVLFPIYFAKKSTGQYTSKTNMVTSERTNNVTFFPFFWNHNSVTHKNNQITAYSHYLGIMPFYGKGTNKHSYDSSLSSFINISPLYWEFKDTTGNSKTLFPLWWYKNKKTNYLHEKRNVLFPLFWQYHTTHFESQYSNEYSESSKVLFPLYWNLNKRYEYTNTFLPFYYYWKSKRDSASSILAVTPLFYHIKERTGNSTVLFPLYWNINKKEVRTNTFLPFYYYEQSKKDSASGFLAVTPLFYHIKERTGNSTVLFPLYWNINKKEVRTNAVLPFYYYEQSGKDSASGILAITPLFYHVKKRIGNTTVLFPVFHHFNSRNYHSTTFFPLLSFGKSKINSEHHTVVTPLFWHIQNKEKATTLLFPLFDHHKDLKNKTSNTNVGLIIYRGAKTDTSVNHSILWPLTGYHQTPSQKKFYITPLIWYNKTNDHRFFGILPLFYSSKSPGYKSFNFLWQVYTYKKMENAYSSHAFLGPLLFSLKFENGDHETRFLHLTYADCKRNGKVTKSIFPFYYHTHDSIGNYSTSTALAFYNNFKRKVSGSPEFYKEVKIFWFIRLRSNYQYLRNKGIEIDRKKIRNYID